jgi:hypothetical protein
MPDTLAFRVVFVSANHGTGVEETRSPESIFSYDGRSHEITRRMNEVQPRN